MYRRDIFYQTFFFKLNMQKKHSRNFVFPYLNNQATFFFIESWFCIIFQGNCIKYLEQICRFIDQNRTFPKETEPRYWLFVLYKKL